jgi:hypothetical protein
MTRKVERKGVEYRLVIEQDEFPTSPTEYDDPGAFIVTTRNREFEEVPEGWNCDRAALIAAGKAEGEDGKLRAFPLYAYVHSGVALSMGREYPFDCPWDSGQIGFVMEDPAELNPAAKPGEQAALKVEEWNQYLSGDVWNYSVERVSKCNMGCGHAETVDSCGGFYGRDWAEKEGRAALRRAKRDAA